MTSDPYVLCLNHLSVKWDNYPSKEEDNYIKDCEMIIYYDNKWYRQIDISVQSVSLLKTPYYKMDSLSLTVPTCSFDLPGPTNKYLSQILLWSTASSH